MDPEQLKQAIEEFKEIYEEEFGITLNDANATAKANGLLDLFENLTELPIKGIQ